MSDDKISRVRCPRRDVVDRVGGFDERWVVGEDYDYFLRACRETRVAFADLPSVRYRVGRADKLARPENALAMADAYLAVLDRTIDSDRDRIRLPRGMLSVAVAHAHRWVGELELVQGDHSPARSQLMRSLRERPRQLDLVPEIALTLLPPRVVQVLLRWRRTVLGRAAD